MDAISLNDSAMLLASDGNLSGAIQLLNQSIEKDSLYALAYSNKANLLCRMGRYEDAIATLNEVLNSHEVPEIIMFRGFIYEKTGKKSEAQLDYLKAHDIYNGKLKKDPDNVNMLLNNAYILMFIYGKENGIAEYNVVKQKFPLDSTVRNMHDIFYLFNKRDFLDSLGK